MVKLLARFGVYAVAFASWAIPANAHDPVALAEAMTEAARHFLDGLTPEQLAQATKPIDDEAARTNWHYLQESGHARDGLPLLALSVQNRAAVHRLLTTALSSQGYGKAAQVMWLENELRLVAEAGMQTANATGAELDRRRKLVESFDSGKYWIVVFGTPGEAKWGWTISGHHLAINFTVAGDRVAFTPLFLGAAPQTLEAGRYAGWRTLQHEMDKGLALIDSFDAGQRAAAVQSESVPTTLLADKGKPGPTDMVGIAGAKLTAVQQTMLLRLVDEYIGDASDEAATAQRAAIQRDGVKALHFAWWGPADDLAKRFMYRVHSPSILIEFIREPNAKGEPANHVHSIVRDPRNDYGSNWLQRHYSEQPHQP